MIDLGDRTLKYAISVRRFVKSINKDLYNNDDIVQLVRASGPVGANYIEANERLSKKDFIYRIKICLKEAKESRYWLKLIKNTCTIQDQDQLNTLIGETTEIIRIFASIVNNFSKSKV